MKGLKEKIPICFMLAAALLFSFVIKLAGAEDEAGPVISMDFQDANLKDVLKVFSQQAALNFIASESIKDRRVTLYLDQVSVQDALNNIMEANNLTYEQQKESNIFIVKEWGKPEVETTTRIFPLQYARVKGYELTEAAEKKVGSKEIGIKDVIEKMLTEHGRIIEDSRTNSLIVSDVPSQFVKIEQAIEELDIKLPQVMIEAEIVEASLETIDKLGIQWGDASSGALFSAFGGARETEFPFGTGRGTLTMGSIAATNLGGILAMLAKDTNSRILARPKILTLNNETAEIRITADTAISASQQEISTSGGGIDSSITSAERVETGVTLKVTPQINKMGEITMVIEPSVINTKASSIIGATLDPQTRSAKTTVNIRDGETVIIGGLINTDDEKILRKVPIFGDIPLLGKLFQKKDDSTTDKELIIFITPRLVKEADASDFISEMGIRRSCRQDLSLKEEEMEKILDQFEK